MSPIVPYQLLEAQPVGNPVLGNHLVQVLLRIVQTVLGYFGINMSLIPLEARAIQVPVDLNMVFLNVTSGVDVKPIHSHNDYTRPVPLFDALAHGIKSVEADVWAFPHALSPSSKTETETTKPKVKRMTNDQLYVAHTESAIKDNWTLNSLYLDPIFALLDQANNNQTSDKGVFMQDPEETLYLFIDCKNLAADIFPLLLTHFKRFVDKNYLTYYDNDKKDWVMGPLTVVITGNLPEIQVKSMPVRYFTLDGKLTDFKTDKSSLADVKTYSIVGSCDLMDLLGSISYQVLPFSDGDKKKLKTTIDTAHKYDIMTRFWGNVNWLNSLRDSEDNVMYNLGTDLLNIDDLSISSRYPARS